MNETAKPALRDESAIARDRVEHTKSLIRASDDISEIAHIHGLAQAAEIYARTQNARDAYLAAAEIKLVAERRAGEIRGRMPRRHGITPRFDRVEAKHLREQGLTQREVGERLGVDKSAIGYAERAGWDDGVPGQDLGEFDQQLGVSRASAYNWEKLAEIPEARFNELLEDAKAKDLSMTAAAFVSRDGRSYEARVEPGIYQVRNGRLAIKWTKGGVAHYKTLETTEIAVARKALARAKGKIKETRVRGAQTVGDAYALVRRTLQTLDSALVSLEPEARAAVDAAIGHLHRAEDELVKASNTFPTRSIKPPSK